MATEVHVKGRVECDGVVLRATMPGG